MTLDCYGPVLPSYYATFGFAEHARVRFDARFAHGVFIDRPDVVYMHFAGWPPGGPETALRWAAERAIWVHNPPAGYVADEAEARYRGAGRAARLCL